MKKISRAAWALSPAGIIRSFRSGPRIAARQLAAAFDVIDPFGKTYEPSPEILAQSFAIPRVNIEEVVRELPIIRMDSRPQFVDGALPISDLFALLALLHDWKPELVLEIGTFNGATTAAMALNAPGAVIHTADLPLDFDPEREKAGALRKDDFHLITRRRVGEAYSSLPELKNIVQHFVDSATWDFSPVKGASFFFIDGAHTYAYAKSDTEKCLAVAAPRSRFILHDCDERHPDLIRYVYELCQAGVPVRRITHTSLAFFDRTS